MKRTSLITILSTFVIAMGLIASLWLDDSLGARVVNVVTVITGIIGAVALFFQFKRDKEINTASFLNDFSVAFYYEYELLDVFDELNKHRVDPTYEFDYKKYQAKVLVYLHWVEQIASLVERGVLDFYTIDNVLSYRFFVLVNNKQVQDNELVPNAEFYRGTYYLYERWLKFEQGRGLEIPLVESGLHLTDGYEEKIKKVDKEVK